MAKRRFEQIKKSKILFINNNNYLFSLYIFNFNQAKLSNINENLEKDILSTIKYFDIFDFPLTAFEIWKNLISDNINSFSEVVDVLDNSFYLNDKIKKRESFYFLKNREDIIIKRKNNYIITYNKYIKGIKFIKIISSFFCFKAIFISNNMSIDNSKDESDIDLFIISRKGRIWTSRFISAFIAKFLGLRPTEKTKKDKICLSIFMDQSDLNLKKVCLKNDIHFIYWINQIVPVYDPTNIYEDFIKQNIWTKSFLPNSFGYKTGHKRMINNPLSKKIFRKLTKYIFGNFFENVFKKIELKIFPNNIKEKIKSKDSEDVFVDDLIIKLHDNNNRDFYNNLFLERTR